MNNETTHNAPLQSKAKKRGFNPLLLMLILFGLPYALAWYFLYGGDPVSFEAPSNNGTLISPMIPLSKYTLQQLDGKQISSEELAGNWLLFVATSNCQEACERSLLVMRQARKAMAVDREVIKPILLLTDQAALANMDIDLASEFHTLSIISSESVNKSGLLDVFSRNVPSLENSIFMVDPFGNFMMVYPAGSEQLGLLDDLKRLLKVNPVHR